MNKNLFKLISLIIIASFILTVSCKNTPEETKESETLEAEITYTETVSETTPEVTTPIKEEPEFIEYTVKEGDTLVQIAKDHYGYDTQPYWELIYEANKDTLKDAGLIYPGQVI
ncbi:LysM peptidoglycan-binding domain-containing protein [Actinomycetota bacterium]